MSRVITACRGTEMEGQAGYTARRAQKMGWDEQTAALHACRAMIDFVEERIPMVAARLPPLRADPPFPIMDAQLMSDLQSLRAKLQELALELSNSPIPAS